VTSFEISTEESYHCEHPKILFKEAEGFQITRAKESNILEIQAYRQYFDISVDALGASWAGRGILFHQGYWIQLLRAGFKYNKDRAFRLGTSTRGYLIRGSCCRHATEIPGLELEGCWIGRLLLAENFEGWRRFVRYMGRLFYKPPYAREQVRRGIMDVPENAV
jgi:hypothetical protein